MGLLIRILLPGAALVAAFLPVPAAAAPFCGGNLSPFALARQPGAFTGGRVMEAGRAGFSLEASVANSFTVSAAGNEAVVIDGETVRTTLSLRYGLGRGLEAGAEIPWISHSGGGLDGFIEDWHDFWGLPDGGRPGRERNRLEFSYRRDGRELARLDRRSSGLGDVMLTGGWRFWEDAAGAAAAVRGSLRLPTGRAGDFTGGGTGLSLWLAAETGRRGYAEWFTRAGVDFLGSGGVLDGIRRDVAFFAAAGCEFFLLPRLSAVVQAEFSQPYYHSALTELGADSGLLVYGLRYRFAGGTVLEAGMDEDIIVDTAPDAAFFLSLSFTPASPPRPGR